MSKTPTLAGWSGRPDCQSLRAIERFLESQEMVTEVELKGDDYQPQSVRAALDTDGVQERGDPSEFEVFWYTSGDFSIHYRVAATEDTEQYLWLHDADSDEIRGQHERSDEKITNTLEFDSRHPIDVMLRILATIKQI
jgi:hypothetical protein